MKTGDEVAREDTPWGHDKIKLLLDGEVLYIAEDASGRQYESVREGQTAFETRCRAYDGWADPITVIEAAQLDATAEQIRDHQVRAAVLLRAHTMEWEHVIGKFINDPRKRSGRLLIDRGIDLVRRIERGRHSKLNRVRADRDGKGDQPVCWRCLKEHVSRVGDDCGEDCPSLKLPKKDGVRSIHVPLMNDPVETLSETDKAKALEYLIRTQDEGLTPGETYRQAQEIPRPYIWRDGPLPGRDLGHGPDE